MTPVWFADSLTVLVLAPAVVWLLATLASRLVKSALWQRAFWQMAVVALGLLIVCELSGLGRALHLVMRPNAAAMPATSVAPLVAATAIADPPIRQVPAFGAFDQPTELLRTEYSVLSTQYSGAASDAAAAHADSVAVFPRMPAVVWLGGAVLLMTRLLIGQALLAGFGWRRQGTSDARRAATASRIPILAGRLGFRRRVRIVHACTNSPVAFGLWRPTIGLPPQFEHDFSRGEQDAMLAHELAHLANRDPVWRLAADLVAAVLWWHPLVWSVSARLQAACETAADEACLMVEDGPELLAGCLLALAKRVAPAVAPGWLAVEGSGFRSNLGRRVTRLLSLSAGPRPSRYPGLAVIRLVGAAALAAVVLVSTAWARPRAALTGDTSMKNILSYSWRQSLAGGLLAAALAGGSPVQADEPKKEGDRPAALREEGRPEAGREGDRREGDRREGDRREGDRDRPATREGERRDADPPATRREAARGSDRRDEARPPATRREGERPEGVRPPGESVNRPMDERRRIEDQLAKLRQEHAELARAGRRDAAEGLERRMQELSRRLEELRRAATDRADSPEARRPGFGEGRGFDAPEGRRFDAGRGERRPEGVGERRPEGLPDGRRPEGQSGGRPDFPPGGPPRDELISVLRDLRAEVQNLRQEVSELRERVQRLSPREGERR